MVNDDDTLRTHYPRANRGSVVDPDEGVYIALLHFFIDHVMETPGLGQARVVIEEDPESGWYNGNHDLHGLGPVLNLVWAIEVQDPDERPQMNILSNIGGHWRLIT